MVLIDENKLMADLCRVSLFDFVKEFWEVLNPEDKFNPCWHIEYLCDLFQEWVERVIRGEPKRGDLIVNVPPGSTKSTIFSIMGPAWAWTRMPSMAFICCSYTEALALDLARKARDVILSDKYQRYYPEIRIRPDQNTKHDYQNTKNGMRYSIGAGGSVIGRHAHAIIIDDPIDPLSTASEEILKTINTWVNETLPSRKKNKAVAPTMMIMQRLHQDDPTGHILDSGRVDYFNVCLPAEISPLVNPPELVANYTDGLLDPVRLAAPVLDAARKELGEYAYACQYDQHPIPRGGGKFLTDRLTVAVPPPYSEFYRIYRYWDKAGTLKGGAWTVGLKMGKRRVGTGPTSYFQYWILDVQRFQLDSAQREDRIKRTAIHDGKKVRVGLEQEPGSGGKESAEGTTRRLAGFRVVIDNPKGDKVERADDFSTQVNAGNVFLAAGGLWIPSYVEELKWFPFGRYMDQVDASSGCFSLLERAVVRCGAVR